MAYMLLLTLLVTVATCERSFAKLKLFKNLLRSRPTMSQERLSDQAVLPVENHRDKQLDTSGIVDGFASDVTNTFFKTKIKTKTLLSRPRPRL